MGYKIAHIEQVRKKLSKLPELNFLEREVTKEEAIKRMANEVSQLQKRGYTLDMIADFITKNEIQISVSTLKSYLTRARSAACAKSRKKIAVASTPPSLSKRKQPDTSSSNEREKSILSEKDDGSLSKSRSSSFTPRQDSDDI